MTNYLLIVLENYHIDNIKLIKIIGFNGSLQKFILLLQLYINQNTIMVDRKYIYYMIEIFNVLYNFYKNN